MSQINEIVTELKVIATAFTGIKTTIFNEIGDINDERKKQYPALLIDSRNISINPLDVGRTFLPKTVEYVVKIFFFDTFPASEQKTKTLESKYSELETLANQFVAEVRRRTVDDSGLGFFVMSSGVNDGFVVDKTHNDDLVQMTYSIVIRADGKCTVGTFNY